MAVHQTEAVYQTAVLELLGICGWRAVHHHPLRTKHGWRTGVQGPGCAGWPDVLAVKTRPEIGGRHRLLAAELKSRRGRVEPDQRVWLDLLATAGVETFIWRAGVDTLQQIAAVLQ